MSARVILPQNAVICDITRVEIVNHTQLSAIRFRLYVICHLLQGAADEVRGSAHADGEAKEGTKVLR
jgi:hypothetical protein